MARKAKDLGKAETNGMKRRGAKSAADKSDAPMTPDDATLEHHHALLSTSLRDVEDKVAELSSLRGVYQNARKAAKKMGIDCDAWKRAWDLKKREPGEVIAEHRHTVEWLKRMGSPLGTQFGLFEDVEVRDTVDPEASGFHAGKNGETATNNPHPVGTEQSQAWQAGWIRGQKVIVDKMASH